MISDDQRCHGERKSKAQGSAASQDSLIHHKFLLLLDRSKNIKNIRTNQKELTKEPRVAVWNNWEILGFPFLHRSVGIGASEARTFCIIFTNLDFRVSHKKHLRHHNHHNAISFEP